MIAMALACNPDLIILDEPTTALDVITQDQILRKIKDLKEEFNMAIIHISHDISVIAETCDSIGVMYAGTLVEYANCIEIFKNPLHPYTQGLMYSFPSIRGPKKELNSIPGRLPDPINPPSGCRFHPRCPMAKEICKKVAPVLTKMEDAHYCACHFADKNLGGNIYYAV
jgi:peptide/nickel transport system ATP-binding protein